MQSPLSRLRDLEALVAGQRQDFDALTRVLQARDAQIAALEREGVAFQRIAQNHAAAINDLHTRLSHYERTVPGIAGAKKALESRIRREQKRRRDLITAHPELSEAGRNHVLQTGQLPEMAAQPQADGGEGPESEAEMRATEDATRERELRLVREAEGDTHAEAS